MTTILEILRLAAPLKPGFHLRIENSCWMALVIEDIQQPGPNGLQSVSVAHYFEQNGDLMRDPEMIFELSKNTDETILSPYYWRSDVAGKEQYSTWTEEGCVLVDARLKHDHIDFARLWDRNLRAQGFIEAFRRMQ